MAPLHTEVNTDLRFPSHPQLGKPHQVWPYTFADGIAKTDWSAVKGKAVIIWPDADEPGIKYAMSVARLCKEAGAASVRIVEVPISAPKGWDIR